MLIIENQLFETYGRFTRNMLISNGERVGRLKYYLPICFMQNWKLSELSLDHWGLTLLTLVPVLINFGIVAWVTLTLPQSKTNGSFSVFVFILGLWQLADGLIRLSTTEDAARHWSKISESIILFVTPLAILFGLRFAKWHKKMNPTILFLGSFLVPILLLVGILLNLDGYIILPSDRWNWIANPMPTPFMSFTYFWLTFAGIINLVLFWSIYFHHRRNKKDVLPSLILAIGFTIPILGGIACEVIGPLLFHENDIPLTACLATVFSFMAFMAISKYKILDYSPRHQWESIVKLTHEGILIVNNEDKIMYANDCFCQMVGYTMMELEGKIARKLFSDESDWSSMEKLLEDRNSNIASKYELQVKTKWGGKIWTLISGSPYLDPSGKIIGSIGIHTNITNLKAAEMSLRGKMDELNAFFYKASHDLKSPAASIKGLLSLHKIGLESNIDVVLEGIDKSVNKLLHTTDRLAQIATIKQRVLEKNEIDWQESLGSIIEELRLKNGVCPCEKTILKGERFTTDKYLLDLILRIGIVNAIEYLDKDKKKCMVNISILPMKSGAVIRITDNGPGIADELKAKLFTLFGKGTSTAGVGLGLYTLKAAVDTLGGNVTIESGKGGGASLVIFIPQE